MNAEPPPVAQLRSEARSLEHLISSYLVDRNFLASEPQGKIIYFADSHELRSYIDPADDPGMVGFVLAAEQGRDGSEPGSTFDLKLKNDVILNKLLFQQKAQVGLLPPHSEELDEEIARKELYSIKRKIQLLEGAQREWSSVRRSQEFRELLALANDRARGREGQERLVAFLSRKAPTLIVLLRPESASPQERITALVKKSFLVRLCDLSWEAFGFAPGDCQRLRALQPSEESRIQWISYLSERKERRRHTARANRIDGEALAYLKLLNEALDSIPLPRVSARLVTRAMTLIHAARRAPTPIRFLRHPRLLAFQGAGTSELDDRELAQALVISLRTYREQLKEEGDQVATGSWRRLEQTTERLLEAWHGFEQNRFAADMASELEAGATAEATKDAEFRKLLDLLDRNGANLGAVQNEILDAIRRFGEATFALGRKNGLCSVQALLLNAPYAPGVRVFPMVAGAPGPVDFSELPARDQFRSCDLEELTSELPGHGPERYLAWSLLFACDRRWSLASIYAESAAAIATMIHADGALDEARLLQAQIERLSENVHADDNATLLKRYHRVERHLSREALAQDPRSWRERAAQLLEIRLHIPASDESIPALSKGTDLIFRARELRPSDDFVQSRVLELGLTYYLAALRKPELWPELTGADFKVMSFWQEELHQIMDRQRELLHIDELSRRARAMEILGFATLDRAEGRNAGSWTQIPATLRADIGELREQLSRGQDRATKLIVSELDSVIQTLHAHRPRDLTFAPVWTSYYAKQIVALMPEGESMQLVERAYELLAKVAGADLKTGIYEKDRPVLEQTGCLLERARVNVAAHPKDERRWRALFYIRMEQCYVRLLLARIAKQPERRSCFEELTTAYGIIAADYEEAAIPYFRLDVVLSELGRHDEAFAALTEALRRIDTDPFLSTPNHWVRSTMQRRLARRLTSKAEVLVNRFDREGSSADRDAALAELGSAFQIMLRGWQYPQEQNDYLFQLEARRRINNIVYIASLILRVDPSWASLRQLEFGPNEFRAMLQRLHGGSVDSMNEFRLVHTVGYAAADAR